MIVTSSPALQLAIAILALAFLFFVPGYLALLAAGLSRGESRLEPSLMVIFSIITSVLIASWWGFTLAELGQLSLPTLLAVLMAMSVILGRLAARRHHLMFRLPSPTSSDMALLGILVVAFLLYWPPGQPIFGTYDAGGHFDAGVALGRTGRFFLSEPTVMSRLIDPGLANLPLGLMTVDGSTIVPQFSGLFEVWVAIFFQAFDWMTLGGTLPWLVSIEKLRSILTVPFAFYVTPLFGLLGVCAVYACGRTIYSRSVGLAAAFFLAISLPQVWYSRLAMSEAFTQFLIVGGLAAYARSQLGHRRLFYAMTGSAFGLALVARIDAVFLCFPLALWLFWLIAFRRWQSDHAFLFGPLAFLGLQAMLQYALISQAYFLNTAESLFRAYGNLSYGAVGLGLVPLMTVAYLLANPTRADRLIATFRRFEALVPIVLAVIVVLAGAYAYFVRPLMGAPTTVYHDLLEQQVTYDDSTNLVKLGWYLSPLGIALGLAGMSWTLARRLDRQTWLLLAIGATYGTIFTYSAFITPLHVFWVRRYLIVFIPSLFIFAAAVMFEFGRKKWENRKAMSVRLLVAATLAIALGTITPIAIAAPQYQEATQQLSALARLVPDDGIAVFEDSEAAKWLALPLGLLYGRPAVILSENGSAPQAWQNALSQLRAEGKKVYYVGQLDLTTIPDDRQEFVPAGRVHFDFKQLEMAFGRLPEGNQRVLLDVDVYRLSPRVGEKPLPKYPFVLRVGDMDYGYAASGFYLPEGQTPQTFRQTDGEAELNLPWNPTGRQVAMSLVVNGRRPANVPPAVTTVYVDGTKVGAFALPGATDQTEPFTTRQLDIPTDLIGREPRFVSVRLVTNSWKPVEYGLGDVRSLGIAIKQITLGNE